MGKLVSLKEFNKNLLEKKKERELGFPNRIECPVCGKECRERIGEDQTVIQTAWFGFNVVSDAPLEHKIFCVECGWRGTRISGC